MPEMPPESVFDKLKSLGVQLGADKLIPPPVKSKSLFSIDEVVHGRYLTTPFGNTFVVEQFYPSDYQHGRVHLHSPAPLLTLLEWSNHPHPEQANREKFIFLDTETSGLAGGTGTFAFLIGLGYHTADGFQLIQLFMESPEQEEALLAGLAGFLEGFDTIVTFNGKSFDIPLLKGRHVIHALNSPFGEMHHIDLLPLARRLWRNRLASRALKDLETDILSLARSSEEVPGYMVPEIYFEYLRSADARPINGVLYHNALDIVSLAALLHFTAHLLENPDALGNIPSLDIVAIGQLYESLGKLDHAIEMYERGLQQGLPEEFYIKTLYRYAALYRKQNRLEDAVKLWEKAAHLHEIDACIELAKYYEHQKRNYKDAIGWSEKALQYLSKARMPIYLRRKIGREIEHRIERLKQKR